jgi:hypothetical protein
LWVHKESPPKRFGRPDALDSGQKKVIADRYGKAARKAELADEYDVGVGTIHRVLRPRVPSPLVLCCQTSPRLITLWMFPGDAVSRLFAGGELRVKLVQRR